MSNIADRYERFAHAIIRTITVNGNIQVTDEGEDRTLVAPKYPELEIHPHHTYHKNFARHGSNYTIVKLTHVRNIKSAITKLLPRQIIDKREVVGSRLMFSIRGIVKEVPVRCPEIHLSEARLNKNQRRPTPHKTMRRMGPRSHQRIKAQSASRLNRYLPLRTTLPLETM